jgi:hypothetical protein
MNQQDKTMKINQKNKTQVQRQQSFKEIQIHVIRHLARNALGIAPIGRI